VRVLIVDDQPLVRAGLGMVVDAEPDMQLLAEAGDGLEAIAAVDRLAAAGTPADIVVMDIRMPRMDGVSATRALTERGPQPRVLVLTTFDDDADAFAALQAGASGFLLKTAPPQDLLAALRAIADGGAVVAPQLTRRLLDRFASRFVSPALAGPGGPELTDREREVVCLVAQGLSNAEIGGQLHLADATVKTHVRRILAKLGLRDRVQIVIHAYETGLVWPRAEPPS
jgi:DNA-binding NarL/FixJ family response regulator